MKCTIKLCEKRAVSNLKVGSESLPYCSFHMEEVLFELTGKGGWFTMKRARMRNKRLVGEIETTKGRPSS